MSKVVDLEAQGREMSEALRADFPTVRQIILEEGSDSTGDPALFVWVLLDDKVRGRDLSWSAIKPLVNRVEEMARDLSDAWPYARVRRQSEWADRNSLPEEEAPPA